MRQKHKSKSQKNNSGFVRIISGQWRSRRLPVKDSLGLRPTTDRVKETLFNWLMNDIAGARCLDCFAGSGSLGFEALSRYAEQVVMIEKDVKAAAQLTENLASLGVDSNDVKNMDCIDYLKQSDTPFDIVFIDPPFRLGLVNKTVALLEQNNWLKPNSLIYVEIESENTDLKIPATWQLIKEKLAGQVKYQLYQKKVSQNPQD